ncbi:SMI1/KNR4 family protein [Streptomyces sp. NRRL S-241]|uniref:SMI1/KNR4 family protein n=1 Tax=Streptomyces sp. NRRL S-241 TaxID=1463896 RepID=UPI00068A7402|nr:SMI1/KNR4 family protein [Streptomyces sp. NRRL S-241]
MEHSEPRSGVQFEEIWRQLTAWLASNAPEDHAALRPGASPSDVRQLEDGLGFEVSSDLKLLLSMHDGVIARRSSTEGGAFVLGYSLLDAKGILEWQQNLAEMAEDAEEDGYEDEVIGRTAHRQWVPFAQSLTGDLLFVDHRSDHYGEIGEISFGSPTYELLWPGMREMVRDLYDAVENDSSLPTVGRVPSIHEGRILEWVTR